MFAARLGPSGLNASDLRDFAGLIAAGRGRDVRHFQDRGLVLAQLVASPERWLPGRTADGWLVAFDGQLQNAARIAAELGLGPSTPADVYAAALARWGDVADEYVIGDYAVIACPPDRDFLRLARSPFSAPPLHFRVREGAMLAGSVPRSLFWRDPVARRLDKQRLARSFLNDFTEPYRGWYEDCWRLPLGRAVQLSSGGYREVWHYDLFSRPMVQLHRAEDYVEAARDLLDEAVRASLRGSSRPGVLLSGGLDSGLVAASALRALPEPQDLPTFTYGPEAGFAGADPPGAYLSEFPSVRAFAAANPRIKPHYLSNEGADFRTGQRDLLRAMDCPVPSMALVWCQHQAIASASAAGCDVLLTGNWGNETFSSTAPWCFAEFLRTGRWVGLHRALQSRFADPRPLWRRLWALALLPNLPGPVLRLIRRWGSGSIARFAAASGLAPDYARSHDLDGLARAGGLDLTALTPRSRRAHWQAILAEQGQDIPQTMLGFELLHGVKLRDPTAYRPLAEFCWGCPTELFMRGGEGRWLAREMARGRLPEAQRTERRTGLHDGDWHRRLARCKADLEAELALMADDPEIAGLVDIAGLRRLLERFPEADDSSDRHFAEPYQIAVPLGMTLGRVLAWHKGRNDI
jgi:asparagine synthase (glutamine-hydrolysing)